jgi:WhiB family transcriptional regulator, redox-sensing transcriptional regulator
MRDLFPFMSLGGDDIDLGWADRALCAQTDPDAFYPEKGKSTTAAKRTCMACEVRTECLEYALENEERWGVWGGTSEHQRRKMQRERKHAAARKAAADKDDGDSDSGNAGVA